MMGGIDELEQENGFPRLQQETEALAAEDPLSARWSRMQCLSPLSRRRTPKSRAPCR